MWAYQIREDILAIDRNSAFAAAEERGIKKGLTKGKAEGLAEGEAKGKAEEKEKIARMMKQSDVPIDIIEKCTGLSKNKIKNL